MHQMSLCCRASESTFVFQSREKDEESQREVKRERERQKSGREISKEKQRSCCLPQQMSTDALALCQPKHRHQRDGFLKYIQRLLQR